MATEDPEDPKDPEDFKGRNWVKTQQQGRNQIEPAISFTLILDCLCDLYDFYGQEFYEGDDQRSAKNAAGK